MKTAFLLIIFTFISLSASVKNPLDKYQPIQDKAFTDWKLYDRQSAKQKIDYTLTIPRFYNNLDTFSIQLTKFLSAEQKPSLRIFRNKNQIQKNDINLIYTLGIYQKPDSVFIADYNGDGLQDIKFFIPNNLGCGGFNTYAQVVYLFQTIGTFNQITFTDYFEDFIYRKERDFDKDGNYEIITQTFQKYGNHNYWVLNLYNYTSQGLVNVNQKKDYPIMIQLLKNENYTKADNIPKEKMKEYSRSQPNNYEIKKK